MMVLVGLVAALALAAPKPPPAEDPLIAIPPVTWSMDQVGGDAGSVRVTAEAGNTWHAKSDRLGIVPA